MNSPASGANPLIEVQGITRRYRGVVALDGVALDVRAGEVLGLVGPNGAGKTTLFECMAGVQPRDAGEVKTAESRPVGDRLRGDGIFYMPDGISPWESQRVGWVLGFFAGLHGCAESARDAVAIELELVDLWERRVGVLSRGQRKRLLIALSLMTSHEVVLLDEPFEGLDLRQTRHIADVLRRAAQRGRTLFLSIHQLSDAQRVCDRMVLLSGGRVVAAGTIDELRAVAKMPGAALEDVFLALT